MASKLLFPNRRRKPNNNKEGTATATDDDELALVKAAAWAWYQHGSGSSEGKAMTMSEFDVTRTQRGAPRPSRYKLEAMRLMAKEEAKEQEGSPIIHNKDKKSLLLDTYEVQSISRQIDSLIESSHRNKHGSYGNNSAKASLDNGGTRTKKKIRKGFWLRHGVMCGTEEDVVTVNAHSRKRVPVGNLVKCLPTPNGAL